MTKSLVGVNSNCLLLFVISAALTFPSVLGWIQPLHIHSTKSTTTRSTTQLYNNARMISDTTKAALQGKTALLTGASSGLGRALALQLSHCGVQTLLLSARKEKELQQVQQECLAINPNLQCEILLADLSDQQSVQLLAHAATTTTKYPTIDLLINNGGVSSRSNFVDTTLEVDQRVMQINFLAGAALAKALVPAMLAQQSGKILWISSVQGLVGIPQRTSYAASKFAVQGYCESLRAELASSGIQVHVASPGYIRTNLSRSAVTGDGTPYGKMDLTTETGADPDQVAVTILDNVVQGKMDFTVASTFSATAAIYMRTLCPGILQKLLIKRFEKAQTKRKED
jgi:dehydrogenase/reductase SDR family member 7B